jgi:hypothetical protein
MFFNNSLCGQDSLKYWQVDTKNDFFWEPHCPIMDGYTLWLLRQKLSIDGYQTILNNEINIDNKSINKVQFTNYLPLIGLRNFSSMIGTRYSKFDIQSDNVFDLNKSIQHLWLWTAIQYRYDKFNFTFTTESYYKGDENSLFKKPGNQFFSVLYVGYELNKKWNLILLSGYDIKQMEGQTKEKPIIALQCRYQPSTKLKILFGVPTIFASEWTALSKTDIGVKYFITNESQIFIRQRISNFIGISLQYNSSWNKSTDTYFGRSILRLSNNNEISYNNITFQQHQLYADIELKLKSDIGFSIGFGYNPSSNISLYVNNDKVYDRIISEDNLFVTFSLQFLKISR